jgi:hypothetical protein
VAEPLLNLGDIGLMGERVGRGEVARAVVSSPDKNKGEQFVCRRVATENR